MLAPGTQEKIRLKTNNGKTGYKITKFQLMCNTPGAVAYEYLGKINKISDPNSSLTTVDFTDSKLMAVAYIKGNAGGDAADTETIIFDNEMTNQDIFIGITDVTTTNSVPCNYYIELEVMSISDIEATEITLRNIREVTSVGSS